VKFTYTYRSSDGQRHTAEIEAESREAAFERVRAELGIKPIKVVVASVERTANKAPAGSGQGSSSSARPVKPLSHLLFYLFVAIVLLGVIVWWWLGRRIDEEVSSYQVMTPQGTVTVSEAVPLMRQMIPGNRERIENFPAHLFAYEAETFLARYAEPGRPIMESTSKVPSVAEFDAALNESIRIGSNELTEHIDLKRIVTGMKREMKAYLAGGGTVEQYLAELEKRQRLEISYRENAERRLNDMLNGQDARSPSGRDSLKSAYAYWLKANAQLQSMGIYPLALPDALRSYQMSLNIED